MNEFLYEHEPTAQFAYPPYLRRRPFYYPGVGPVALPRHHHRVHPRLIRELHPGAGAFATAEVPPEAVGMYDAEPELGVEWFGPRMWNSGAVRGWRNSVANHAPSWGARAGQWVGGQIGRGVAHYVRPHDAMPFDAVPFDAMAAGPEDGVEAEGILGNAIGWAAPHVGGWVGGRFGHPNAGRRIGHVVGSAARIFSPWDAGPEEVYGVADAAPMSAYHDALETEGILGNAIGWAAPHVGGWVGRRFGHPNAGRRIGRVIGSAARIFSPWDASPEAEYGY